MSTHNIDFYEEISKKISLKYHQIPTLSLLLIYSIQDMSLQRLFDRVISGKSAAGMQAEQLLQLDYFRKTIPTEILSPPLPPQSTMALPPQSTVALPPQSTVAQQLQTASPVPEPPIPQLNQQMEIGVFDVKDVM